MSTTYESMRVERADGVAEVTLLGPGKGNAMGPAFFRELREGRGSGFGRPRIRFASRRTAAYANLRQQRNRPTGRTVVGR